MSDGPELTPDDVKEILRLVDEAGFESVDLETARFTVRFRRSEETAERVERRAAAEDGLFEVTAPMVGIFYRAPAPGEAPFVEVGSRVDEDTTVCILEVMKLMSSVTAGVSGEIAEVCVENAAPVEYGDLLFRVRPR